MKAQTDFVKTALRLPPDLHAEIHRAAEQAERSYNAEIVHRLRESLKQQEDQKIPS